jgi:hypothetical protein
MFNWIKRKVNSKLTKVQAAEVDDWTKKLKFMDASTIGITVVMSAHIRNIWRSEHSLDLLLPDLAINLEPYIALQLLKNIKNLQKTGNEFMAGGFFPWLFTVRACYDIDLVPNTRELWRQLERGFNYVDSASENIEEMFGFAPLAARATEFPLGFTPDPL